MNDATVHMIFTVFSRYPLSLREQKQKEYWMNLETQNRHYKSEVFFVWILPTKQKAKRPLCHHHTGLSPISTVESLAERRRLIIHTPVRLTIGLVVNVPKVISRRLSDFFSTETFL